MVCTILECMPANHIAVRTASVSPTPTHAIPWTIIRTITTTRPALQPPLHVSLLLPQLAFPPPPLGAVMTLNIAGPRMVHIPLISAPKPTTHPSLATAPTPDSVADPSRMLSTLKNATRRPPMKFILGLNARSRAAGESGDMDLFMRRIKERIAVYNAYEDCWHSGFRAPLLKM
ncbi:hypothetical protein DL89DRAFT_307519 [Linderina pennispora]|uniref:Uncharacterized protein n=1 Tax=Linderina pennispora TaxID=61395 RepID=A0A1Y1VYE3_9FUNG|nr:uncharacterized protein DL89DRAFT_307519 [Linderina pennispora]ORX66055.1 hypothetical protein DL89DRAFT_307519 [Linderina pennispora]